MKKMITSKEALTRVRQYVNSFPTLTEASNSLKVSKQYLSTVMEGYKPPYSIMEKLGWERVVMYQKKSNDSNVDQPGVDQP